MPTNKRYIVFFLPAFRAGGQEHTTLLLMSGLADRGHRVELWLEHRLGDYLSRVPPTILVRELRRRSRWSGYPRLLTGWPSEGWQHLKGSLGLTERSIALHRFVSLVDQLEANQPDVLISAHGRVPLLALWAAGVAKHRVATVIIEHSVISPALDATRTNDRSYRRARQRLDLMRRLYPRADQIVTVSQSAAVDMSVTLKLPPKTIKPIYNPVLLDDIVESAALPVDDNWFAADAPPVIVTAGRLAPEKGYDLLIDAFARLRAQGSEARLAILGEGPAREQLTRRISEHGLDAYVRMPGWVNNPYGWMARSALCVLSSEFEGFSNTLIEAMACGCPVVATDCPGGPAEILDRGRFGRLVPLGDVAALAQAMALTLTEPRQNEMLQKRAAHFSLSRSIDAYETMIERLGRRTNRP